MARGGTKEGLRGWRKKGRGRRGRGGWGGANCSALGTEVGGSYRGGREGGGGGGGPVLKCGMQGGAYGSSEWASGSEGDALGASEGGVPTGPC